MQGKWNGGVTKHPEGYIFYVPNKSGPGLRKFFANYDKGKRWQASEGAAIWGARWPEIKKNGISRRIQRAVRNKPARKGKLITPGVREYTSYRVTPAGTLSVSHCVAASYMTIENGKPKQRTRSWFFGKESSKYTREEAIEKALNVREEKTKKYLAELARTHPDSI